MGFRYHVESLDKDVSFRVGCLSGRGNIATIKAKIEERKRAVVDPGLELAVDKLGRYFDELADSLGEEGRKIAEKQEFGGEMLEGEEAAILERAEARTVSTTITSAEAKRLAKLIRERTADWGDGLPR